MVCTGTYTAKEENGSGMMMRVENRAANGRCGKEKRKRFLVYMSPTATMAFFSNLRIPSTKATTLMLLFALVLSTMSISMAQEEGIAIPEEAASHSVHVQFCVS